MVNWLCSLTTCNDPVAMVSIMMMIGCVDKMVYCLALIPLLAKQEVTAGQGLDKKSHDGSQDVTSLKFKIILKD
jgi:hypothetical protein